MSFSYAAATGAFQISDFQPLPGAQTGVSVSYGSAQRLATQPDARFTEYRTTSGANGTVLRLYKPGSGNSELALTYASFGIWDQTQTPDSNGKNYVNRIYFTFGIPSPGFFRSGSATYSGIINGSAGSGAVGSDPFSVNGNFSFNFDFAADTLTGTFSPVGTNSRTGATTNFGTYALTQGKGPLSTGAGFASALSLGAAGATGQLVGSFFGPSLDEIAGRFAIRENDTANAGQFLDISGAFVGKK
jgi:hypothetical protein